MFSNVYLFGDGNRFVEYPEIVKSQQYSEWTQQVKSIVRRNKNINVVSEMIEIRDLIKGHY